VDISKNLVEKAALGKRKDGEPGGRAYLPEPALAPDLGHIGPTPAERLQFAGSTNAGRFIHRDFANAKFSLGRSDRKERFHP